MPHLNTNQRNKGGIVFAFLFIVSILILIFIGDSKSWYKYIRVLAWLYIAACIIITIIITFSPSRNGSSMGIWDYFLISNFMDGMFKFIGTLLQ